MTLKLGYIEAALIIKYWEENLMINMHWESKM